MVLTFSLLALAVVTLWMSGDEHAPWWRRYAWLAVLVTSTVTAMVEKIVQPIGLVWLVGMALALSGYSRPRVNRWLRVVLALVIVVLGAGLLAHQLPGFHNPRVIYSAVFSPGAVPYTLYLNFDKTVAGLLILALCQPRISQARDWWPMLRVTAPWAGAVILTIMLLSIAAGFIRFAPKFPAETWLWLGANLLFVCMAEEALFRGFIQGQLQRLWQSVPGGHWFALAVAAVTFGLAHATGGQTYVLLAIIAGLGYGWVYLRTARIESSILAHYSLNVVHFFLFTYPSVRG